MTNDEKILVKNKVKLVFSTVLSLFFLISCNINPENSIVSEEERQQILTTANSYLDSLPVTVTSTFCKRSQGGLHDYYSEGDYWWPDPENPGAPFIRRDGMSNPENFVAHRKAMRRLSIIVPTLVSAYLISKNKIYARKAIEHLMSWFVNSDTRMNPNLLYSQAIHGRYSGRGIGIIDTIHLVEVVQAIIKLQEAGVLEEDKYLGLDVWFREYLRWLTTHQYGIDEKNHGNNHSTCWVMQVAMFSKFTHNDSLLKNCRLTFKNELLPKQMDFDGSFPKELARTKPYSYSLFNLDAMTAICRIASTAEDNLWEFTTNDGKNIQQAVEFLYPFAENKFNWPFQKDIMYFEDWPMRHSSFLFAYQAYDVKKYVDLWKFLPYNTNKDEVLRNYFIRQPLLWLN